MTLSSHYLYCPNCGNYLIAGDGECHDCHCGWKQLRRKHMKYAFEVKTLVMVEAESEDEAWDLLPATAREALCDFDYERSSEDDKEE